MPPSFSDPVGIGTGFGSSRRATPSSRRVLRRVDFVQALAELFKGDAPVLDVLAEFVDDLIPFLVRSADLVFVPARRSVHNHVIFARLEDEPMIDAKAAHVRVAWYIRTITPAKRCEN